MIERALVIGFGSIGQRHTRILQGLNVNVAVVSRRKIKHRMSFRSIESALKTHNPNYVIIASRTHEHYADVCRLIEFGFSGVVLIEKPLFANPSSFPTNSFERTYVAFNMRFQKTYQALKESLNKRRIIAIHGYVGQYLPDWRPGNDYRKSYSAIRGQGGGVLRDLCHELDMAFWLSGHWQRLTAIGGKFSDLEIDSDDCYTILAETERCPLVTISLNYLDTVLKREMTVLTDQGTVRADIANGTLMIGSDVQKITTGRDQSYINMHQAVIGGDTSTLADLVAGQCVQSAIFAAEISSKTGDWAIAGHCGNG